MGREQTQREGRAYAVDVSTDLLEWENLSTAFSETGMIEFVDADAPNHPARFYRLRWAP